jgi:16S rRNA (cytosine967-C5)-methyltransferase
MSRNVRGLAARILCRVEEGGFADALIDGTIKRGGFANPADPALLTEIVMGTLRHRLLIDETITKYLTRSIDETDPFVRNAVRIGAYQMLFLSRVPPHAALNETVEAVKRKKGGRLAGLVNGVLRSLQRDLEKEGLSEVLRSLSLHVRHSIPSWMVDELARYVEKERLEAVLERLAARPPAHVRINSLKDDAESIRRSIRHQGIRFSPHPAADDCLVLADAPPLAGVEAFRDGSVTPQDVGSVLVARVVAGVAKTLRPHGGRFLDACSAPGIKTSYLCSLLPGWELWATDVSGKRIESMRGNFARMGVRDVTIERLDFTGDVPAHLHAAFDLVFVDAPCSGLGVMRRNPEVKWRIGKEDVDLRAEKARVILGNALFCLKDGGYCLYSTCTFTGAENENVVKTVSLEGGCVIESVKEAFPDLPGGMAHGLFAITPPDLFDSDFFFIALMKKEVE